MQKSVDLEARLSMLNADHPDGFATYMEEAEFGWQEIRSELLTCDNGLEIGAGSGLLACLAAYQTPAKIAAIEPIADGFGAAEGLLEAVDDQSLDNLDIIRCTLGEFSPDEKFDLIWSVNVFEHLSDWRSALLKTRDLLSPNGRAILLVPNYNIPYEPHFRIPLVGGRVGARALFSDRINRYENANEASGLWDSLNFFKASELLSFADQNGLDVEIDRSITVRMFERFKSDQQMRARQGVLAFPAAVFRALRLHYLWAKLPAVMQPYLRVILHSSR